MRVRSMNTPKSVGGLLPRAALRLGSSVMLLLSLFTHGPAAGAGPYRPGANPAAEASAREVPPGLCNRPFVTVLHAFDSGLLSEEYGLIDNEAEWCELWDQIHSLQTSPPPCNTRLVDFGREVAVLAALGSRPTGCYDVEILCVHSAGTPGGIRVLVRETVPGDLCACTDAFTSPVVVARIARPASSARFKKAIHTLDCSS